MNLQSRIVTTIGTKGIEPVRLYHALHDHNVERIDGALQGLIKRGRVQRITGVLYLRTPDGSQRRCRCCHELRPDHVMLDNGQCLPCVSAAVEAAEEAARERRRAPVECRGCHRRLPPTEFYEGRGTCMRCTSMKNHRDHLQRVRVQRAGKSATNEGSPSCAQRQRKTVTKTMRMVCVPPGASFMPLSRRSRSTR